MRTIVKGKNVEVPDRVREYAERKLQRIGRLTDDRTDAIVELSNEKHKSASDAHRAEVTLIVDGATLHSHATGGTYQAALDTVLDKAERQAVDYKRKPRLKARPEQEKQILRRIADGTAEASTRTARGQDEALRDRADVRGGRDRRDGGARPRVLRVRQRRDRTRGDPLRPARRQLRAHRTGRRRRLHERRLERERAEQRALPSRRPLGGIRRPSASRARHRPCNGAAPRRRG